MNKFCLAPGNGKNKTKAELEGGVVYILKINKIRARVYFKTIEGLQCKYLSVVRPSLKT